jgi:hypothetical protein
MRNFSICLIALIALSGVGMQLAAAAQPAVSLDPNQPSVLWGYPVTHSNHGWEFTVNRPIDLTHIGMLDATEPYNAEPDGFTVPHSVGLFRTDGTLLTSGTLSAGTGDLLVNGFRYVPVPPVSLVPGEHYAVVYHTDVHEYPDVDHVILGIPSFQPDPAINYLVARWGCGSSSLGLPPNLINPPQPYAHRFGANFLFVPEPGTLMLLLCGMGITGRWKALRVPTKARAILHN